MIELGSISVDTAGKQVLMDGRVVELTAVEYGLVELLALHRGKVVSRSMIYEHLFDENHDSLSNMVDVYISRLRSRLARILHTGSFA